MKSDEGINPTSEYSSGFPPVDVHQISVPLVSVVMPCLNEERTVGGCIKEAIQCMSAAGIKGEVVVADNGSHDNSASIAVSAGATVVSIPETGYGNALRGGIMHAQGEFIIMGDCDGSYPFTEIPSILNLLQDGYDLVIGDRFAGGIEPGAMPWLHRYVGNPILSWLGRFLFRSSVSDFHCGLRGFSRSAYEDMALTAAGMEFASEMVIRAAVLGLHVTNVPVHLRRDGRVGPSHLRTWRDGARNLCLLIKMSIRNSRAVLSSPAYSVIRTKELESEEAS